MGWNSPQNKSIGDGSASKKQLPLGMPVSNNPSFMQKAYRDGWDIERAYREGMSKITWVNRCIDAIAGNQARLQVHLKKDNFKWGEIVVGKEARRSSLLELLNNKANVGENSFIFRYRMSAQLLLGTRGVFIEKIRGKDGSIIGLNLLPPHSTAPIPDPKKFVAGYEVMMPTGEKINLKPEDVCWIRRPHPLDPYLSLTPLEAAGVAIEIENLAKLYNRNYLLNDGRPGGILVVRGEIDEDDKEELKNRFRGNLSRAGQTTVIAADEGVDYVDTSASPRDTAYAQMRQITKEEILSAFGVPESVIGNAAGRTFSNAAEEIRVFWVETMLPHLEPIARGLDELDDKYYVDFDTSEVPILMLYKQERDRYLMSEFQSGLISANEYRIGSARKEVESDLADSLLANPNLIPIANTKKKMEENQAQVPGPGGAPGMPGMPGMPPGPGGEMLPPPNPLDPNTMQGAMAAAAGGAPSPEQQLAQTTLPPEAAGAAPQAGAMPVPSGALSASSGAIQTKTATQTSEEQETAIERWSEILSRGIERVIERQQRVVLEKVGSAKSRKAIATGSFGADSVFSQETWDRQMDEDIRPVLFAIVNDSFEAKKTLRFNAGLQVKSLVASDVATAIDAQIQRINQVNELMMARIIEAANAITQTKSESTDEQKQLTLRREIIETYANFMAKDQQEVADDEARASWFIGQVN
jgi:HK97 family phage portal protein